MDKKRIAEELNQMLEEDLRIGLNEAIRTLESAQADDEYQEAIDLLNQRLDATFPGG